jgi:hypothetical protein
MANWFKNQAEYSIGLESERRAFPARSGLPRVREQALVVCRARHTFLKVSQAYQIVIELGKS